MWQGVLDRLEADERRIGRKLRETLEEEFRFVLETVFDADNAENMEKEVKEIIRRTW
jgi:hypothetical protein